MNSLNGVLEEFGLYFVFRITMNRKYESVLVIGFCCKLL